jgi:hypothetical protein
MAAIPLIGPAPSTFTGERPGVAVNRPSCPGAAFGRLGPASTLRQPYMTGASGGNPAPGTPTGPIGLLRR